MSPSPTPNGPTPTGPTPSDPTPTGGLDRRDFLGGAGAAALLGLLPARGAAATRAAGAVDTLVIVFLRGGMDGLSLLVPYGDAAYAGLRGGLALARPGSPEGAVDLDGFFGLHPRAASLAPLVADGRALALCAVGHPNNTRSHFAEQDLWETGVAHSDARTDGWLNRHLSGLEPRGPIRAVALADGLPRLLRGDASAVCVRALDELAPGGSAEQLAAYEAALRAAHGQASETSAAQRELAKSGRAALAALRELGHVAEVEGDPDVRYPAGAFGARMRDAARLVRADIGVQVVAVDYGGWDTHQSQGGARGTFAEKAAALAGGLVGFCEDVGDALGRVLVVCVSEFGRTAAQNGTGGTDHGWANCAWVLGGALRARGVVGEWPGLAPDALWQRRDLRHTTDFRDLLFAAARAQAPGLEAERLFPGHAPGALDLIAG